jgi:hypothetical protein
MSLPASICPDKPTRDCGDTASTQNDQRPTLQLVIMQLVTMNGPAQLPAQRPATHLTASDCEGPGQRAYAQVHQHVLLAVLRSHPEDEPQDQPHRYHRIQQEACRKQQQQQDTDMGDKEGGGSERGSMLMVCGCVRLEAAASHAQAAAVDTGC